MLSRSTPRRTLAFLVVCVIAAGCAWSISRAQDTPGRGITATPMGASPLGGRAGETHTFSVLVTNLDSSRHVVRERLLLPDGWKLVGPSDSVALDPGSSDARILTFLIPRNAPSATYEILYSLWEPGASDSVTVSIRVAVEGRKKVAVIPLFAPDHGAAGSAARFEYLVRNEGNVPLTLTVRGSDLGGREAIPDSSRITLDPGESRTTALSLFAPIDMQGSEHALVLFSVTDESDSSVTASATGRITLVPSPTAPGPDTYLRMPLSATARFATEEGRSGFQGEIMGEARLGRSGERHFALLLRSPDLQETSILGQLDEYRLAYSTPAYQVYGGDMNYVLSPLTELGRMAFGGGGDFTLGDLTLGGFYNRNRRTAYTQEERAAFASFRVTPQAQVSLQYLGKTEQAATDILSLRTLLRPASWSNVDVEFARGFSGDAYDDAYAIRVGGRTDLAMYDLQFIQADPGYRGYYRDVDLRSANVVLFPWDRLRIEGFIRDEDRNLNRDTLLFAAPRYKQYWLGAGFGDIVSLLYKREITKDQLLTPRFDRELEAFLIRAGATYRGITMTAEAELGTLSENVYGTSGPYRRYTAYLGLAPFVDHSYGLHVEYLEDRNVLTNESVDRLSGTLSAHAMVMPGTWIRAYAHVSKTLSVPRSTYGYFDIGIQHQLPFGHLVGARMRYSGASPSWFGDELALLLEYTVPLSIPVMRSGATGGLTGRISDGQTGIGLAGVLVMTNGQAALTDDEGRFAFPALRPGEYSVRVDGASLGRSMVLTTDLSKPVRILGGEDVALEIFAAPAGVVTGRVVRFAELLADSTDVQPADSAAPRPEEFVEIEGIADILVEAEQAGRIIRQFTDRRGVFQFDDLAAGEWTIRIVGGELPARHRLEVESLAVTVQPSARHDLLFRVVPRKVTIQILDQGEIR